MLTVLALDRLDTHQARVGDLLGEARSLVFRPVCEAREGLARIRWQMVRVLREYQIFKHSEIFDPVIASSQPLRAITARNLKTSCIEAGERYRLHTLQWSAQGIEAEWPAYKAAMEEMCRALEAHLTEERAMVATLLSGTERTRLA